MVQNNTWKHYLTIGLIISQTAFFSSCIKDYRYTMVAEYRFVNETNYAITYPAGYESFNILPNTEVVVNQSLFTAGRKTGARPTDYISPLSSLSPTYSLTIKFDNVKCLKDIKENDVNSIRNIRNFVAEKIGENHFRFTYTFTEADYNRAVTCP